MARSTVPRTIALDPETGRLAIRFPYDPRLLDVVRDLPGRRWDPQRKLWTAPVEALEEVVAALGGEGFEVEGDLREQVVEGDRGGPHGEGGEPGCDGSASGHTAPGAGRGGDRRGPRSGDVGEERAQGSPATAAGQHLTILQLNERVRGALRAAFHTSVWLVGEVSGWDRNAHKSHVFFELVEKDEAGERSVAAVTAVLFSGNRDRVDARLADALDPVKIQDGVVVRLRARVDLFPRTGSYQVVVEDIDPAYTLGALALERERIYRLLEERGLARTNASLPLPALPLRVALVTSWGSDASNDVIAELSRAGYAFRLDVYDAYMQGPRLEATVRAALDAIAGRADEYDVCLVCRGGGARTELAWFDNLELAVRAATLPLKLVCGIGHQRDVSVLDLIAHSEKTPTAAAKLLVAELEAREGELEQGADRLGRAVVEHRDRAWSDLGDGARRLRRSAIAAVRQMEAVLDGERRRVLRAPPAVLRRASAPLVGATTALASLVRHVVREERRALGMAHAHARDGARRALRTEGERLDAHGRAVRAHDPRRVLARGYAIVRSAGRVLRGVAGAEPGARIEAELADGWIDARVDSVRAAPAEDPEPEERDGEGEG